MNEFVHGIQRWRWGLHCIRTVYDEFRQMRIYWSLDVCWSEVCKATRGLGCASLNIISAVSRYPKIPLQLLHVLAGLSALESSDSSQARVWLLPLQNESQDSTLMPPTKPPELRNPAQYWPQSNSCHTNVALPCLCGYPKASWSMTMTCLGIC